MSARVSSKRPSRRCTSESNSSNGKIMLNVDLNMNSDASYGSFHAHAPPPRMAAPVMPQSNQSVGQQSTTLQSNAPIDVEAIDDDVVLLPSSRDFPQGRNKSRRTRPITVILDEDLDVQAGPSETSGKRSSARPSANNHSRQKVSSKGTVINCEIYEKSELGHEPKKRCVSKSSEPQREAPKEPAFTCSICWGQLVEETSTICGHIFCQGCIKAAIHTQKKCPTCRRPLTMKNIHRVYLPVTN